ncbi:MAG TPA: queuosine salvage family protein [Trueperaceae bacterium]|nr:queuosine salvage family protein [Trueperaceae bacterium]
MLQRIRDACARVAQRARFVRIAGDAEDYLATFDAGALTRPAYDTSCHYLGDPEATVTYVIALDAVNFGSGYFPSLRRARGERGYRMLARGLSAWFEADAPGAERLAAIGVADVAEVLGQDLDDPLRLELMRLYAEALRELGGYVTTRFGGRFTSLVDAAGHRAERLAALLAEMPFFRDVWRYDGLEVPLYKRAQIAASDLALAFGEAGYGAFNDLERLTMFADNQVPHVLRCDGVLEYAPALARRIDRGERLRAGSPEEIELRAVALAAVERIVVAARNRGLAIRARDLDVALWERGQGAPYAGRAPHRTLTTAY